MRETLFEESREIPVVEDVDVAVVGGGTAGFVAALAAARNGAKTALIEKWGYVGGAAVGGLVITIPEFAGVWGIEQEFHERLKARGGMRRLKEDTPQSWVHLSPADCKILGDEMLIEAGVIPLYHSLFTSVARREGRIDAVIVENKSGRQAVRARVFVDATGDGDVAARAGVPFTLGDGNGRFDPVTMMYMVAGVDIPGFRASPPLPKEILALVPHCVATEVHAGELNCWGGRIAGDATDVREMTRMEMHLRACIHKEFANMRRHWSGMESAYISILAEQIGVRETRHVHADYMVTGEDCKQRKRFADSVGRCWDFTVPFRSLCASGMDNLLLAGRCIGVDSVAGRALRIVPNCCTTGQAAGTAAALAALAAPSGGRVRDVDSGKLQETLASHGVRIE